MPVIKHAVIAAAGMGTRLGHGLPKCLLDIDGRPLIEAQLELLGDVPDVRVVVGYMENDVMDAVRRIRPDVVFVRNPRYSETTTQDSYALGAQFVNDPCVFMDADIWFEAESFHRFLSCAGRHELAIGITASKTDCAVYVQVEGPAEEMNVIGFSRTEVSEFEWANIVWAPAAMFVQGAGAVFERLTDYLPAPALEVCSFEVDTEADLKRARAAISATTKDLERSLTGMRSM